MFRKLISIFSLVLLAGSSAYALEIQPSAAAGHPQLESEIDQILQRTRTPGAAVALFEPDGSVWRYTPGLKNLALKQQVEPDTIFRIGSISKLFVGLATMKLVEAGALSLDERLADLAPEVEFDNPWESEHPVRLIHLLNHSTGWDAPHAPELVGQSGRPLLISDALKQHSHSRQSRWVPGTRSAYNNSGPLVAAYIIEKVTGQLFEDYIQAQFLDPLGMGQTGYYYDDQYRSSAASMYRGRQEQPYWHLPNRAAGGLHSSLPDMISLVRFMQQPNSPANSLVLNSNSVRSMEHPTGSSAAAAGLEIGWGIGLTSFHYNGLVYYGHEGSLPGANAVIAYQPEGTLGHVVLTNSDSPAAGEIHRLLARHAAENYHLDEDAVMQASSTVPAEIQGYYRVISPIAERNRIAASLMPWKLSEAEGGITLAPVVGGMPRSLWSSGKGKFIQPGTGRTALVSGLDPIAGSVIHYGPMTMKKTGFIRAIGPLILLAGWLLFLVMAVVYLLIWLPRHLIGHGLAKPDVLIRSWPIITVVGLLIAFAGLSLIRSSSTPYVLAASITFPSLLVFTGTVLFFLGAMWSLSVWWQTRKAAVGGIGKALATILIFLNAAVSIYLLSYGLIGIRLWA